jgi:hypothetical protein
MLGTGTGTERVSEGDGCGRGGQRAGLTLDADRHRGSEDEHCAPGGGANWCCFAPAPGGSEGERERASHFMLYIDVKALVGL